MVDNLAQITDCAVTPDQILPYVSSVSGLKSELCRNFVLHHGEGYGVLIGYANDGSDTCQGLDEAVAEALARKDIHHLTVIAPKKPGLAPEDADVKRDSYWLLSLPCAGKGQKLRNMLKRARREVEIVQGSGRNSWTSEHARLAADLCQKKGPAIEPGTKYIFEHLDSYLENAPDAVLFSAFNENGKLAGCAIGDYSALNTAFYMFAFRAEYAPPGVADLLLEAVIAEAEGRGHGLVNLGLGIDGGIEFFKKKWGATPALPCVETVWEIRRKPVSWLKKLFG